MKKIIEKIKKKLSDVFGHALEFFVKNGDAAVKVTNIFKELVENPALAVAVLTTKSKTDDVLLAKARVIAPRVALKVAVAMNIMKEIDSSNSEEIILARVFKTLRDNLPEEGKAIFYREFSGAVGEALVDGKISRAESIALVQMVFKKLL